MKGFFNKTLTAGWLCIFGVIMFIAGCGGQSTYFKPSNNISQTFEKGEVLSGHQYYIGGPAAKPNAVVAIRQDFTLESEHWSPIEVTSESLKNLVRKVGFVDYSEYKTQYIPNGAQIVTPAGEAVGIWYSVYRYSQIRMLGDGRMYISYPQAQLPRNLPIPKRS